MHALKLNVEDNAFDKILLEGVYKLVKKLFS